MSIDQNLTISAYRGIYPANMAPIVLAMSEHSLTVSKHLLTRLNGKEKTIGDPEQIKAEHD